MSAEPEEKVMPTYPLANLYMEKREQGPVSVESYFLPIWYRVEIKGDDTTRYRGGKGR
jgi:hypothetical protein